MPVGVLYRRLGHKPRCAKCMPFVREILREISDEAATGPTRAGAENCAPDG